MVSYCFASRYYLNLQYKNNKKSRTPTIFRFYRLKYKVNTDMKVVIVNGSPRKSGNTAQLCNAFQDGVMATAPDCEIVRFNLDDLTFKGCRSCFSCKLRNSSRYGVCSFKDELSPVLDEVLTADCIVVASPIYFMDVSSAVKAFLERLCFSLGSYEQGYKSLAPKKVRVVTIYTMNTPADLSPVLAMDNMDMFLNHIFSAPKRICAYNTYQFSDYSKYVVDVFDEKEKAQYREKHWPCDLETAYNTGREIACDLPPQ